MRINDDIKCSFTEIPFKTTLSFKLLIKELTEISKLEEHPMQASSIQVLEELKQKPALLEPIDQEDVLDEHRPFINKLMGFVFNPSNEFSELSAATPPFTPKPFFTTKLFNKTLKGEHRVLNMVEHSERSNMMISIIYQAYHVILKVFYDVELKIDAPFTLKLTDEETKTIKYFKLQFNSKYTEVKAIKKLKKLSSGELREIFDRASDLDFWNEKIPLKMFEFTGFLQFNYIDITQDYVISQLKSDLLDKNSIITNKGFNKIKEKVRALFEIPDLEFGLAAATDFNTTINQNMIWKTIIPQSELKCKEYEGSFYETAFNEKRIVMTPDFKELEKNKVISAFLKKGIRSHVVVPLMFDEEYVGLIEFGTSKPSWLNLIQINRVHDLFPVFAIALKRSKEEWNDRIRGIIQEEFTAIHPTVAWRFREAAISGLSDHLAGKPVKLEPIVFSNVIPIYGATDIRNSSIERNAAIQADLSEHLSLIKSVLTTVKRTQEMPLLDILSYKIEKHMQTVNYGLKAGDEISIIDFFQKEVEPVFAQLTVKEKSLTKQIDQYFEKMDPELGVLYKKRKDFEDSLTQISEEIGTILDQEQLHAQKVFPHYFEKYRTDGVEYNIYIGQSMVKNLVYDEIYLSNIRIWQLLTMIKIARRIKYIQPELRINLDVTQLILVQSNPLSIAFRQDEKKFDVAGAYNIRYEITKKRIDKAVVKGSRERVTQPGKIAIIYSLSDEIDEYKNYIAYLIAEGFLNKEIEYLELEDLQGTSGLRAMRVAVDFKNLSISDDFNISEFENIIKSVRN